MSRETYMALLRAMDPRIAARLDRGFEFVTKAFRPRQVPPGVPVRDRAQAGARRCGEGWGMGTAAADGAGGRVLRERASRWRRRRSGAEGCQPLVPVRERSRTGMGHE